MRSAAAASALALSLAACGSDSGVDRVDAAPVPDAQELMHVVQAHLADVDLLPLPGVEVCIRERPDLPCATSDADGMYTISAPREDVSLTFTLAGHESLLLPISPTSSGVGLLIHDSPSVDTALSDVGLTFPGAPLVAVNLVPSTTNPALDGASFTLSVAADGPIYSGPNGLLGLDPALTTTSTFGFGVFGDMAEGNVEVTVDHPIIFCTGAAMGGGWFTSTPNRLRVPAVNGFDTVVVFGCQ